MVDDVDRPELLDEGRGRRLQAGRDIESGSVEDGRRVLGVDAETGVDPPVGGHTERIGPGGAAHDDRRRLVDGVVGAHGLRVGPAHHPVAVGRFTDRGGIGAGSIRSVGVRGGDGGVALPQVGGSVARLVEAFAPTGTDGTVEDRVAVPRRFAAAFHRRRVAHVERRTPVFDIVGSGLVADGRLLVPGRQRTPREVGFAAGEDRDVDVAGLDPFGQCVERVDREVAAEGGEDAADRRRELELVGDERGGVLVSPKATDHGDRVDRSQHRGRVDPGVGPGVVHGVAHQVDRVGSVGRIRTRESVRDLGNADDDGGSGVEVHGA